MAKLALETRYQRIREEAIDAIAPTMPESSTLIVSFGDHDCIVDVLRPGDEDSVRYIYYPEDN